MFITRCIMQYTTSLGNRVLLVYSSTTVHPIFFRFIFILKMGWMTYEIKFESLRMWLQHIHMKFSTQPPMTGSSLHCLNVFSAPLRAFCIVHSIHVIYTTVKLPFFYLHDTVDDSCIKKSGGRNLSYDGQHHQSNTVILTVSTIIQAPGVNEHVTWTGFEL